MFKLGKKVFVGVLAAGFLLVGTGLLNASAAHAATGQEKSQTISNLQTEKGNQGQLNTDPQSGAPEQQTKQPQPDQQEPKQQPGQPQPTQQQPKQQQPKQQVPKQQPDQQQPKQQEPKQQPVQPQSKQQEPKQQPVQPQPTQQPPVQPQYVPESQFDLAGGNLIYQTADILNVDAKIIIARLKNGRTLAEIAEDYGVSEGELLYELERLQRDAVDDAVAAGSLTHKQADKLKGQLAERLENIVESTVLK
jgi:hypothetical protein